MGASSDNAAARGHAARKEVPARAQRTAAGRTSLLVFAAAQATGDGVAAARALRAARRAGASRVRAEEAALMLMLYAGYPAALEGLRLLNAHWPGRARATDGGAPRGWRRAGERLCLRVYGPRYPRLVAHVRALHPDLAGWMLEQGYGRVLSRPGMPAAERERFTVTVLAALGWERQLLSHLLGAGRLGVPRAAVRHAFDIGLRRALPRGRAAARRAWRAALEDARWRHSGRAPRRLTTARRRT